MTAQGDSLWQLPGLFPLKVIVNNKPANEKMVVEIVRRHLRSGAELQVSTRQSSGGLYLAVNVTFTAHTREQLDAIYKELSTHQEVLMAL
jgi:putative lipoic acid-binding regulatory protein